MALYAKLRAWVVWLFWFYIRYGREMPRRKALAVPFVTILVAYFVYEATLGAFSREPGWTFNKVTGYLSLLLLPPCWLPLYGYFFGYRHQLEKLDPVYTRPTIWEPIGFFIMMLIIGMARWHNWS